MSDKPYPSLISEEDFAASLLYRSGVEKELLSFPVVDDLGEPMTEFNEAREQVVSLLPSAEVLRAMYNILDLYWDCERRDCEDHGSPETHIFQSLDQLRQYLELPMES